MPSSAIEKIKIVCKGIERNNEDEVVDYIVKNRSIIEKHLTEYEKETLKRILFIN